MDMDNIFILKDLIDLAGGKLEGVNKIQSIVYILQEFKNPFKTPFMFRYNFFGLFSADLRNEINIGKFFKILKKEKVEKCGYIVWSLQVEGGVETESTSVLKDKKYKKVMQLLNKQSIQLLRVISFIIYYQKKGLTRQETNEKLESHMEYAKDLYEDGYEVLRKLQKISGWGNSL